MYLYMQYNYIVVQLTITDVLMAARVLRLSVFYTFQAKTSIHLNFRSNGRIKGWLPA